MRFKNEMKKVMTAVVVCGSIALTACSTSDMTSILSQGSGVATSGVKLKQVNHNRVKLYYGNAGLPKHYKVIGRVSAESYNLVGLEHTQATIAEELKKQAGAIGATGVINIANGFAQTTGDAIVGK